MHTHSRLEIALRVAATMKSGFAKVDTISYARFLHLRNVAVAERAAAERAAAARPLHTASVEVRSRGLSLELSLSLEPEPEPELELERKGAARGVCNSSAASVVATTAQRRCVKVRQGLCDHRTRGCWQC